MGFRRVLRSDFPHLKIDERAMSDDRPETTAEHLMRYFSKHDYPAAIYNVAGANRGVAQALSKVTAERRPIFVGHELTVHTRAMLESGVMDYVISHDFVGETAAAVRWIRGTLEGARAAPPSSRFWCIRGITVRGKAEGGRLNRSRLLDHPPAPPALDELPDEPFEPLPVEPEPVCSPPGKSTPLLPPVPLLIDPLFMPRRMPVAGSPLSMSVPWRCTSLPWVLGSMPV